jgi:hypothetical protein
LLLVTVDVTRQCFCAGTSTKELPPKRQSPLLTIARRITLIRRVKNTANKKSQYDMPYK